jgi:hypothetical protein
MYRSEERHAARLGGLGILTKEDLAELNSAVLRVFGLMSDWRWHKADEIRQIAGKDGKPATEGLRRMRELRSRGFEIEMRRAAVEGRAFEYRLAKPVVDSEP